MKRNWLYAACLGVAVNVALTPETFGQGSPDACFYFDKDKTESQLAPLRLTTASGQTLALRAEGLFHGDKRACGGEGSGLAITHCVLVFWSR
jgi:hypothetical protein